MKRLMLRISVMLLTFLMGIALWFVVNPLRKHNDSPLLVTILPASQQDGPNWVRVKLTNVSSETIRGYSLGHTCACRGWNSEDKAYPAGISYLNPSVEHQRLEPGESQELPLNFDNIPKEAQNVWVDLVHFEGKGNWGPNLGRKEGYVRE